ncbi:MAG: metalloregulator ArsR/SmtB family transcription factor [Candidatus Marinimicrobia bacterium]|nr:metalloregulator ArsR/SmtB family transcription factor [Candidatus Neomarinimicrobiota bacterium]MDD5582654.1 metalloregulator ArsR/SmtB family transcription factor [Candidatus Neomarinimicrobiota bacterium]
MTQKKETVLPEDSIERAALVLKTLGHPIMLKILLTLQKGESSVAEIQKKIGEEQTITSIYLRKMLKRGIVKYRKEGRWHYYSLTDDPTVQNLKYVTNALLKSKS